MDRRIPSVSRSFVQVGRQRIIKKPSYTTTGLTQTISIAPNSSILETSIDRTTQCSGEFSITGLDGSSGGLIWEQGGSVIGSYMGFRGNGDFVFRVGGGQSGGGDNTSILLIERGFSIFNGDGTFFFSIEVNENGMYVPRIFWNEKEYGRATISIDTSFSWSGTNDGEYLKESFALADGEISTPVTYTTATDLIFYDNQTILRA